MAAATRLAMMAAGAYGVAVNAASYGLFAYDKNQAKNRGWRIPEKSLCLSAALGGWIGGLLAMKTFHHKTKKQAFQAPYLACMGANIAAVGFGLATLRRTGKLPVYLQKAFK